MREASPWRAPDGQRSAVAMPSARAGRTMWRTTDVVDAHDLERGNRLEWVAWLGRVVELRRSEGADAAHARSPTS